MESKKLQIALYWGAACGGCDVAVLDTNEFILDVAKAADIRFWPIAVDGKYSDVEGMRDGELDLALFNGAVRNSENEHVAKLLRQKSKILVAFGSCAHMGGIPGLANLTTKDEIFATAYLHNPSIEPGNRTVPSPQTQIDGMTLDVPAFYRRVYRLKDVVDVRRLLQEGDQRTELRRLEVTQLPGVQVADGRLDRLQDLVVEVGLLVDGDGLHGRPPLLRGDSIVRPPSPACQGESRRPL